MHSLISDSRKGAKCEASTVQPWNSLATGKYLFKPISFLYLMCYGHAFVPLHNEDSDFFQGFPQSLQLFQFSFLIKFQKTVTTNLSSTCPPLLLAQEELLIACCKHFGLRISFIGHSVFAWATHTSTSLLFHSRERSNSFPDGSKHVWTDFPSSRVSKRYKYIIMSSHCLSLISPDLAGVKQTWHNLVTLEGAKGHTFNYNPHYLLWLSEFVNIKAQVV